MQVNVLGKFKPVLYLLFWLLAPATLWAQTTAELDTRLQNGRSLLDQQKYSLAITELLPVINSSLTYNNMPQALYFYSVAALKAKKIPEADTRIAQLLQQYSTWPNIEEARYLAANIAFEQKDYAKALQILKNVDSRALAADESAMKQNYLAAINNKNLLQTLVQQNPDDKDVATVYADKLLNGWYTGQEKSTLENIVQKFNLDKQRYTVKLNASSKKGEYNVAVLLPFQLDDTSEEALRKNQTNTNLFSNLYAGMLLARDSLAKNNIHLNLFAYDAPADTNKVKAVLNLPEMKSMDLIIGPVYKNASKIIAKFAQQNQIIAINPLSDDISLVQNNPYLYLFNASRTTQARKTAAYAYEHFNPKTAVIVYSNTEDGLAFAKAYREEFEKRGGKVTAIKSVSPSSSGTGVYSGIDLSSVGHIMVASNHAGLAYNTMSILERQPTKIPVITYASWLDFNQISLKQLDNQEIYFIYPKYVDTTLPHVKAFRRQYTNRFNVPPYVVPQHANTAGLAYTGFDLLYYFGNVLARNGSKFNQALASEGAISGAFYQGIGYGTEHDNQYVPLFKLEDLQLNVVNPVFQ